MKITFAKPSLSLEAVSFIETLEFRVKPSDRGASVLSIGTAGDVREFAPVELWPDEITKEYNLKQYGILEWPYRGLDGEVMMSPQRKDPATIGRDLADLFAEKAGRQATEEELKAIHAQVVDQAKKSAIVNAWAQGIDFVALHAIPFDGIRFENGGYSQYNWLARSAPDAQAMKRFIVEHPMLAGVATAGSDLFEAAKKAASPQAAYEALVAFVTKKGFPCTAYRAFATPPIPHAVLDCLKGVPSGPYVMGEEAISDTTAFLTLAVKLTPVALPNTPNGVEKMTAASRVISCLAEELDAEEAVASGYGFGIDFSDHEIRAVLRAIDFEASDVQVWEMQYGGVPFLGQYGVILAGREDWVRHYNQGGDEPGELEIDFSALKEALIRDGYVVTAKKAQEAIAELDSSSSLIP